jgi:protein tyrosine phosphatase (PTP) superfamily phosphohydrolase (DUF442 family)
MKPQETALSEIYKFHSFGDKLATGGQPTEAQLRQVREAGFDTVINLALPTSDNALPNEGSIVTGLGMTYVHIPVNFKAPASEDFRTFSRVMHAVDGRSVFVHCAANMRVSAFIYLYRVMFKDVAASEARHDLNAIWQPDDVWSKYIEQQLEGNRP